MDGVVSGVFLIVESGLRNDGKRKAKAGGESSGVKSGTSLARTSPPTPPASAGAGPMGPHQRAAGGGPRGGEEPSEGCLGRGVGSHVQGRLRGRQDPPGPLTRVSLGNTCQFPGNWKRPWRFFFKRVLGSALQTPCHLCLPVIC